MAEPYGIPIDPNPVLPPGAIPPGYGLFPGYPGYPDYPGYPGYPGYPPVAGPGAGPTRPPIVLAAAILGYVVAGLLVTAGLLLAAGVSLAASLVDDTGPIDAGAVVALLLAGAVDLISGTLLLAGGMLLTARRAVGRVLFTVGGAMFVVAGIVWLARVQDSGVLPYDVVFTVPTVVGLGLVWAAPVTRWLAAPPRA